MNSVRPRRDATGWDALACPVHYAGGKRTPPDMYSVSREKLPRSCETGAAPGGQRTNLRAANPVVTPQTPSNLSVPFFLFHPNFLRHSSAVSFSSYLPISQVPLRGRRLRRRLGNLTPHPASLPRIEYFDGCLLGKLCPLPLDTLTRNRRCSGYFFLVYRKPTF